MADANSRIELNQSDYPGYLSRGTIEVLQNDFLAASNDLQTAVNLDPTNSEIYLYRGMVEQKLGKFDVALADYSQGLACDTEATDAFRTAEIDEAIGYAHAEMGQWQPALGAFRKVLGFDSPSVDVRFEVFLIECRLGQTAQAKEELTAYLQSVPAAKAGDWSTCIGHFLAGTLNESNFLAQATSTARRPTDVAMQTGDAYYFAGMEHWLSGDKTGASERFKKCLKIGDDNSDEYMMARSILGAAAGDQTSAELPSKIEK
jgi:tetratricopeptide (TPR) repeat protein